MKNLFSPKSVAIIGGSEKKGSIGNILIRNLLDLGFKGRIFPVNPKYKKIGKLKCYSTVLDIEDEVQMAVIAIPAALTIKAVQECAWRDRPIKDIIIISAGFSEAGTKGKKLEQQLKELSKEYGLNIIGPNCLGIINATEGVNISFSKNNFNAGNIGLIMQSGAFTTALFDMAKNEGLGFSLVATLGNKAVLDETDFLELIAGDQKTKILGIYVEDIKRGKKFIDALCRISQKKPVVILKAGNSKKASEAMLSHTGAMAGEAEVVKEAISKNGGIFVASLMEFVGTLKLLSGFKQIQNNKIAIITNAGGPGVVTTDIVESEQFVEMQQFSGKEEKIVKEAIPEAGSAGNPIDVLGDADPQRYGKALDVVAKTGTGAVIAIVTPQAQTDIKGIAEIIQRKTTALPFPILPVFLGADSFSLASGVFANNKTSGGNISNFSYPSIAVRALSKTWEANLAKPFLKNKEKQTINKKRSAFAGDVINKANKKKRQVLFYPEARELADAYSIKAVTSFDIYDESDIEKYYKKQNSAKGSHVLKVDSPDLLHKNAKGGIVLNIKNQEEMLGAYRGLRNMFKDEKLIIQPQTEAGTEVIIGTKKDPNFGHMVLAGIGGIMTEIFNKKITWLCPISREEIEYKLRKSFFEKVFKKQSIDLGKLVDYIEKVSLIALENPQIAQMDINPVMFFKEKDPVCVDIKVIID